MQMYNEIALSLKKKLGSQAKAAKAVGVSQPAFGAWLKGKPINSDNLASLLEAAEAHGVIVNQQTKMVGGSGKSIVMRELDARFGAGGGGVDSTVEVATNGGVTINEGAFRGEPWEMPLAFLNGELKVSASGATVAEVVGDSGYDPSDPNAPGSLMPGDRVIIDTRDCRPSPPGPFAVFDGMGFVIKLVEIIHGHDPVRLRLASRNPAYPPYDVTVDEAHIVGRVKGRITRM